MRDLPVRNKISVNPFGRFPSYYYYITDWSRTVFESALPFAALELIVLRLNHRAESLEADKMSHFALASRGVNIRLIKDVIAPATTRYTTQKINGCELTPFLRADALNSITLNKLNINNTN